MTVKPCPFCGGTSMIANPEAGRRNCQLLCDTCGALGPNGKTEAEAAERWNGRRGVTT